MMDGWERDRERRAHQGRRSDGRCLDRHGVQRAEPTRTGPRGRRGARWRVRSPNWVSCPTDRLGSCGRAGAGSSPTSCSTPPIRSSWTWPTASRRRSAARDLSLFLCNSNQDSEREDAYLADLAELRARGVLITAVDPSNPRLDLLRATWDLDRARRSAARAATTASGAPSASTTSPAAIWPWNT